jgi:hypothetical protein
MLCRFIPWKSFLWMSLQQTERQAYEAISLSVRLWRKKKGRDAFVLFGVRLVSGVVQAVIYCRRWRCLSPALIAPSTSRRIKFLPRCLVLLPDSATGGRVIQAVALSSSGSLRPTSDWVIHSQWLRRWTVSRSEHCSQFQQLRGKTFFLSP